MDRLGDYELDRVHLGDGLAALESLPAGRVGAVVSDPPYGMLGDSGQKWDYAIDADRLLGAAARALRGDGALVLFGRGLSLARWVVTACDRYGFTFKEEVVWRKRRHSSAFTSLSRTHEMVVVLGREDFRVRDARVEFTELKRYSMRSLDGMLRYVSEVGKLPGFREKIARLLAYRDELAGTGGAPAFARVADIVGTHGWEAHGFGVGVNAARDYRRLQRRYKNIMPLVFGGRLTSVMEVDKSFERGFAPTAKPVLLLRWLVQLCTDRGAVVVDPYAGGGSTVLGAMKEGRRGLGFELNPPQHAVAAGRVAAQRRGACVCGSYGQRRVCEACQEAADGVFGARGARRGVVGTFDAAGALRGAGSR